MVVRVVVVDCRGEQIMDLCDTEEEFKRITVLQLKEKICQRTGPFSEGVQLMFGSECLEDNRLLTEYGIRHMSHIIITLLLQGGGYGPGKGDGGMGDKEGKSRSMERLFLL